MYSQFAIFGRLTNRGTATIDGSEVGCLTVLVNHCYTEKDVAHTHPQDYFLYVLNPKLMNHSANIPLNSPVVVNGTIRQQGFQQKDGSVKPSHYYSLFADSLILCKEHAFDMSFTKKQNIFNKMSKVFDKNAKNKAKRERRSLKLAKVADINQKANEAPKTDELKDETT